MKKLSLILLLPILMGMGCTSLTEDDNFQWPLEPIACSQRAAGIAAEGKIIDCESDNLCKLVQTSSCPTCDDVVYRCIDNN